jgi:glycosyltransferase involved in cell wall biosynthesis
MEYYRQDIDILRDLGFEVVLATRWREVPSDVDLYFVWWWHWGFLPMSRNLRKRPCLITGTLDLSSPLANGYYQRPWWHRCLMRYALKNASANVFISARECEGVGRALKVTKPSYVPEGVDTDVYREGNGPREDYVLTVSKMIYRTNTDRKCIPEIIRAIPLIHAEHPKTRFIIAGEKGGDYARIEVLAQQLGVAEYVEFSGVISRDKKIRLMQRCKVYLSPSRYEGFGLAILEAMSCGAAVVSSPAGAVPEVVGDAGLLVDGSSPEAIAAAVNRYLGDESLRREMGIGARLRAETAFPVSRRKRELEQVIAGILKGS